jgi:predicted deacylase
VHVEQLGEGEPELARVGGIHGDEPGGVGAVERLRSDPPAVERPVKLVIANERAVEAGERFVDVDLNRSFPGDPTAGAYERRLAAELSRELDGCRSLAFHSTQSHSEPFAIVSGLGEIARDVAARLSVVAVVDTGPHVGGRLFVSGDVLEIECGLQGTGQATENAHRLAREFLAATGALAGVDRPDRESVPLYRLTRAIPKDPAATYEVFAENFTRVEADEPFAAADGERVHAEAPFYPVLLSADGYDDLYGYAADHQGKLP